MKAQKCRLCKHHHWSHEPHIFDEEPDEKVELPKPNVVRNAVREQAREAHDVEVSSEVSQGTLRKRAWRAKNKERYNEYQRNWMKAKRSENV